MTKWVKCSERVPEKVGRYLVFRPTREINSQCRIQLFCAQNIYSKNQDHHRLRFINTDGREDKHVKFWSFLPEAPKDE